MSLRDYPCHWPVRVVSSAAQAAAVVPHIDLLCIAFFFEQDELSKSLVEALDRFHQLIHDSFGFSISYFFVYGVSKEKLICLPD